MTSNFSERVCGCLLLHECVFLVVLIIGFALGILISQLGWVFFYYSILRISNPFDCPQTSSTDPVVAVQWPSKRAPSELPVELVVVWAEHHPAVGTRSHRPSK